MSLNRLSNCRGPKPMSSKRPLPFHSSKLEFPLLPLASTVHFPVILKSRKGSIPERAQFHKGDRTISKSSPGQRLVRIIATEPPAHDSQWNEFETELWTIFHQPS